MSEKSDPYVLGGTQTEQQRLVAQAAEFETQSCWLLDQVDIQPGWRAADIGCGPIGILNLLSEGDLNGAILLQSDGRPSSALVSNHHTNQAEPPNADIIVRSN